MTTEHATASLRALDAAHHLHPFTNTRELNAKGPRVIVSAKGCHLQDSEGNRILDGMAGLWCAAVGFGRPEISAAVAAQLDELTFYNTFFNTTHPRVVELSSLLAELTPPQFNRFFYTCSGSEANDTILKLAKYYWELMDQPERKIFISRRGAYHGSTIASAQLGGFPTMHEQLGVAVGNILHAPPPNWWESGGDLSFEEFGLRVAEQTLSLVDAVGAHRIAAFIGEPIQGGGGVIIPPKSYWPALAKGLKDRDVLLISDEVICGFGRTGNWFGCETFGTEPDFMTMAKGISSGYVPLGAVAVSDRVANVLVEKGGEVSHGFTYSGHPAACAAAIANINILKSEMVVERVRDDIGPYLQSRWLALAEHPLIGQAQMAGLIGAIQLTPHKSSRKAFPEEAKIGLLCREHSFNNGLVMRAVGDRMIVAPPLVLTHADADELIEKASRTIEMTFADVRRLGLMQ